MDGRMDDECCLNGYRVSIFAMISKCACHKVASSCQSEASSWHAFEFWYEPCTAVCTVVLPMVGSSRR